MKKISIKILATILVAILMLANFNKRRENNEKNFN